MDKHPISPEFGSELEPKPALLVLVDNQKLIYQTNMVDLTYESQTLIRGLSDTKQPLSQRDLLKDRTIDELNDQIWLLTQDIKDVIDISQPIIKEWLDDNITYHLNPSLELLPTSQATLNRLAKLAIHRSMRRRSTTPLPNIDVFQAKNITTNDVYEVATTALSTNYSNAPAGWLTNKAVAKRLGSSQETVALICDQVRHDNPNWFAIYEPRNKKKYEYLHPDLVTHIARELETRSAAPKNWETLTTLSDKLGIHFDTLARHINKVRGDLPNEFGHYSIRAGKGKSVEYFSPKVVQAVIADLGVRQKAPEGWITRGALAAELGLDFRAIKAQTEAYQGSFKLYVDKGGSLSNHLPPEIADKIRQSRHGLVVVNSEQQKL